MHYSSDASFDAIGGYCPDLEGFWCYTIDPQLLSEMNRTKSCEITSILLELCGMIITAFVVQSLLDYRPTSDGESVMMRGDKVSVVS